MHSAMKVIGVLTLASSVLAGQCWNHIEGAHKQNCVKKEELVEYKEDYCNANWSTLNGDWVDFSDSSGNTANIGKVSTFSTKQVCEAAFDDIVDNCYNGWDGGSWAAHGVLLTINFCKW